MKKFLAGTTALVAAAVVAGQAQAADPVKVSVGGFIAQGVGYIDQDKDVQQDYAEVTVHSDSELYFRGSTKLDNGLTVGVNIDLYTDRGDTGQDDVFISIASDSLGKVKIGATKGSSYGMSHKAPAVGYVGLNDGAYDDWSARPAAVTATDDDTMVVSPSNDGNKIAYTSPNFGGVQVGFSYGLDATGTNETAVDVGGTNTGSDTMMDAAIAYNGEVGGVGLGADVSYSKVFNGGTTGPAAEDETGIRGGLSLSIAGFTVGGSYMDQKNSGEVKDIDFSAWDAGVSYATGPYAVSFTFMEVKNDETATGSTEDTQTMWALGGSYDLGAGVSLSASAFGVEYDDGSTNTPNSVNDNDAFGIVTGISVSF